jgi:hypothetical protein
MQYVCGTEKGLPFVRCMSFLFAMESIPKVLLSENSPWVPIQQDMYYYTNRSPTGIPSMVQLYGSKVSQSKANDSNLARTISSL